jgi:hypothetical protein
MPRRPAANEKRMDKPFDALQTLLATARELANGLAGDQELERLVRAFKAFPAADREALLQVIEKDAAWRTIVENTDDTTGIRVKPNPHASLYVHVLEQADGETALVPDPTQRDADVIRQGVETFVQMLPFMFQDAVREQWLVAGRDLARSSGAELRELAVRFARDIERLATEAQREAGDGD